MGGRDHKETQTWIPPDFACVIFSYVQKVYPCFITVTNLTQEYNYMPSPKSSFTDPLNVDVLRDPNTSFLGVVPIYTLPAVLQHDF